MGIDRVLADLESAQARVSRLEARLLEAKEAVSRLTSFIQMARQYEVLAEGDLPPSLTVTASATLRGRGTLKAHGSATVHGPRKHRSGRKWQVIEAVSAILQESNKPLSSRELLQLLEERHIKVGNNPERAVADLASILSKGGESLVGKRGVGWTYVPQRDRETLDSGAGDDGEGAGVRLQDVEAEVLPEKLEPTETIKDAT